MSEYGQDVWKKLNTTLFKTLESSASYCRMRGVGHIEIAHWLYHLHQLPDSDWRRLLTFYNINTVKIDEDFFNFISHLPEGKTSNPVWSDTIINLIERAWFFASVSMQDTRIRSAWLLATLLTTSEFRKQLLSYSLEFGNIPVANIEEDFAAVVARSPESVEYAFDGSRSNNPQAEQGDEAVAGAGSLIEKYCINFSLKAQNSELDPVIGREQEIRTMVDILLRRRQNNPLLVGEAGVGKTAVVEGLALAILHKNVPPALQNNIVLNLDVGALLAGASMKGEFESRLKSLIKEMTDSPRPIILFIDEIHVLVGAGGQAGTGDAANLLKPILARGGLKTVGATTWSEYKKYIEKDPALARRFQVLQIHEPDLEIATDMVRGLVDVFSAHHNILITDSAIRAAVSLSSRYIPSRQLPDKAISLLDTACSRVSMGLTTPPQKIALLQQRLMAQKKNLDVLQNESELSGQEHLAAKETLLQSISTLEDELAVLEQEWQIEYTLSAQIQAIRAQIIEVKKQTVQESEEESEENVPELNDQQVQEEKDTSKFKESEGTEKVGETQTKSEAIQADEVEALSIEELHAQLIALEEELRSVQDEAPSVFAQVDENVVADIVSEWTGIPVGRMMQNEVSAMLGLADTLKERVIGQDDALSLIAKRVQTAKAGLLDENKPRGVFLLVGPSGIGKTETALSLAEALFGGEQNMITINMSEYQESHTVSSLKGAPPGYVGYGEGGVLTEAVRRKPYSIVLLDEIEKAHKDVHEIFYQVFDKGWMEDGEGRYIDFKNTIIIMTSNAASEDIEQYFVDPELVPSNEKILEGIRPQLEKVFPVAFLGRLTIIPYYPLSKDNTEKIVKLHLNKVVTRASTSQGITLTYSDALTRHIVEQCSFHSTGVRHIIHYINDNVLPLIANMWFSRTGVDAENLNYSIDYCSEQKKVSCVSSTVKYS